MKFPLLLAAFFLMTMNIFPQTPPLEPGVSNALAKWRAANYSDVRYKLNITLEKGAPLMKGEIEIRVKLTETGAKNDLILDWRTTQFANDKDKPFANVVAVNDAAEILTSQPNEHIRIPKDLLKTGENYIKIQFASPIKTSGAAITRYVDKEDGAEYIYSLFVPSDASTAFPVFDQPDLKARFQLNIISRSYKKFISNTPIHPLIGSFMGGAYRFEETQPISAYVFAFAAGEFAEFGDEFNKSKQGISQKDYSVKSERLEIFTDDKSATHDPILKESDLEPLDKKSANDIRRTIDDAIKKGEFSRSTFTIDENNESGAKEDVPLQSKIYVRKSQAEKFKQHAGEVFRLNREGVKFLETYFDYKFPFPKYDLVLIPEFPFGGMEHAGATFLRESSVIFPTEPTKNDYVSRANLIFHEAAHQWFGDTVTMKWFDDLWLKEGFAEFLAYKTLAKVMPEYNAWKIFYERNKQAAYLTDSTKGTTPIYQEIPNLSAAKSAYGNIVYRKAPSFLKQAEFYQGVKEFQTAVRAFLKKHEFKNAEWTDLVKEFETASKQDLKDWANVWVKKRGMPIIRVSRNDPKELRSSYVLKQKDILNQDKESEIWRVSYKTLEFYEDGEKQIKHYVPATLDSDKAVFTFDNFRKNPISGETERVVKKLNYIFPNYQDYGYGIFLLDERSRAYVLENIQNEKDDFLRTMMWGSLWDSVREAELAPKDYVALVVKNINVETDESTIQTLLGRVSTAMNYYLSDKQREEFAPQIENLLLEKMRAASTVGQKITFYRAFLNTASSEKAGNVLKEMLSAANDSKPRNVKVEAAEIYRQNENARVEFPPLKTKDKFDIVTRLLILGDKDAPALLAALEKTETSDEAKRYAYAAKAGIATAENKAKFYNDFVANKEISESWVESAFAPFNAIRHAELTLPYLEKALAELPNLKKNRKIFFVNGWLGAFIGGQKSEQALAIVNKFLAGNPNLDKDLRLKILENVDGLERAVKIRGKYGTK